MNELSQLYQELLAGGYKPQDIPGVIAQLASKAGGLKAQLIRNGYPQSYVDSLSMNELFNVGQNTLPLNTGQTEIARESQGRVDAENALQGRAGTALQLDTLLRQGDADRIAASKDPFRLGEHLVNLSNLPQGTGNPIQQLLGEGTYIDPQYTPDPRIRELEDQLATYARTDPVGQERRDNPQNAAVRAAYARDPVNADRYFKLTEEQRRALAGLAGGGKMVLPEPSVVKGARTGRIWATLAEEGPEMIEPAAGGMKVTPMKGVPRRTTRRKQDEILDMERGRMPSFRRRMERMGKTKGSGLLRNSPEMPPSDFPFPMEEGKIGTSPEQPPDDFPMARRMRRPKAAASGMRFSKSTTDKFKAPKASSASSAPAGPGAESSLADRLIAAWQAFNPGKTYGTDQGIDYGGNRAREIATKQGSTGLTGNVRDEANNAADPNNLTIIIRPDGTMQVTQNVDPNQRGSTVYDARSGRSVARPATQDDITAAQAQRLNYQKSRASVTSSSRGALDPMTDRNVDWILRQNQQYGMVPLHGFKQDGTPITGQEVRARTAGTRYNADGTPVIDPRSGQRVRRSSTAVRNYASGGSISFRESTAKALGKGLQSNPFAHPDMVQALLAGRAPLPGSVTQRFLANADPMIVDTLFGSVYPAFGTTRESVGAAVAQFRVPGFRVGSVRR